MKEREKLYRRISSVGGTDITIGILILVTGIVTGVIAIVNGARLLSSRKHILL